MSDSSDESSAEEQAASTPSSAPIQYKFVPCRSPKRVQGGKEPGGADDYEDSDNLEDRATSAVVELAVVGDANVGKTSILRRFAERKFHGIRNSTIGVEFINVWIMSNAPHYDRRTCVNLVDTAGQDRFMAIVPQKLRSPYGIFFVFDATNRASFDSLTRWNDLVSRYNNFCCRMLVANKIDLYKKLPLEQRWMESVDWNAEMDRLECDEGFSCVSALDGENIDSLIVEMVDLAIERQDEVERKAREADLLHPTVGLVQINNNRYVSVNKKNTCKC